MERKSEFLEQIQQVSPRFAGIASQQVSGSIGQHRFHAFVGRRSRWMTDKLRDMREQRDFKCFDRHESIVRVSAN